MHFRRTAAALSRPLQFGDREQLAAVASAHRFDEALQRFRQGKDDLYTAIKEDRAGQEERDAWEVYAGEMRRRMGVDDEPPVQLGRPDEGG